MFKVCLTGGPCGGKSSSLTTLKQKLESRGYNVVIVPEGATKIISSGVIPGQNVSGYNFQKLVLEEQLHNEELFEKALEMMGGDKNILIFDRGIGDQYAYLDRKEMNDLLFKYNITQEQAYARYDCVIHLKTAADGAIEHYQWNDPNSESVGNNAARFDSPEDALEADKRTLKAWIGHPHLRVIDNSTDFTGKVNRAMKEVFTALGEPVPCENERKFLIRKPSKEEIDAIEYISMTHITQTYLKSDNKDIERRIRKRGTDINGYSYYYTEKSELGDGSRKEVERLIDAREYATYLEYEADTSLYTIEKDRYCFLYKDKYFEMDLYPFENEYAILEVELNDMNEEVELPKLDIIKEVTYDTSYRNNSLAHTRKLGI